MGLPKIDLPLFETKLLSTGKIVKYRPFTVKEEKILLMAQEAQEAEQIVLAMRQIVTNCCEDVEVDSLPMFDLEYLMLQIRSKSVNNMITFNIKDEETGEDVQLEMDIDEIVLHTDERHSKEIKVNDDMHLMMKYPTLDQVGIFLNYEEDPTNTAFDVMISCIDCVVNGDEVASLSEYSIEEIRDFVDNFPGGTIESLKEFFETIPALRFETTYKNSKGTEQNLVLEGTDTFFL